MVAVGVAVGVAVVVVVGVVVAVGVVFLRSRAGPRVGSWDSDRQGTEKVVIGHV